MNFKTKTRDSLKYLKILELDASINKAEGKSRSSSNLPVHLVLDKNTKNVVTELVPRFSRETKRIG